MELEFPRNGGPPVHVIQSPVITFMIAIGLSVVGCAGSQAVKCVRRKRHHSPALKNLQQRLQALFAHFVHSWLFAQALIVAPCGLAALVRSRLC